MRQLFLQTTSRYTDTDLFSQKRKSNNQEDTFFGTYKPRNISISDFDNFITVRESDLGRLDLLAYTHYGDSRLWWVLAQANDILDPFYQLEAGTILRVPKLDSVL